MFTALREHASKHALSYVIAMMLGFSAGLTAVYDNFWPVDPSAMEQLGWWQIMAIAAKCVAAASISIVGYLIKSPLEKSDPAKSP